MINHYVRILEAVAGDPGLRLSQLPMLSGDEWQRLVAEFNETATEVSGHKGACTEILACRHSVLPRRSPSVSGNRS